ncbi:unnamed protein product [Amoebophrya sp. A120]|nr:unnamed protein product [Amoebophrya sp. A120]|eukprot:GSA120T00024940001.1
MTPKGCIPIRGTKKNKKKYKIHALEAANAELKERVVEHDTRFVQLLGRIRFCGAVTWILIEFALILLLGDTRKAAMFAFQLLFVGFVFVLLGTILPWRQVMCPKKVKRHYRKSRHNSEVLLPVLEDEQLVVEGAISSNAADITTGSGGDHGARGEHLRASWMDYDYEGTSTIATRVSTSAEAATNIKTSLEVEKNGLASSTAAPSLPDDTTGADIINEGEERTRSDDNEFELVEEIEEVLPYDFEIRGTLSCVTCDQGSAAGKIWTLALVLYMISTLLSAYTFEVYESWCPWRSTPRSEKLPDTLLGDPGMPKLALANELIARGFWLVVPSFCFVVTAVIETGGYLLTLSNPALKAYFPFEKKRPKLSHFKATIAKYFSTIHGIAAPLGMLLLVVFESVQLFWGENVPVSYLTAIFDPVDAIGVTDSKPLFEAKLWQIGCLDYATSPRPWNRIVWLRLVFLCGSWVFGLLFVALKIPLNKAFHPRDEEEDSARTTGSAHFFFFPEIKDEDQDKKDAVVAACVPRSPVLPLDTNAFYKFLFDTKKKRVTYARASFTMEVLGAYCIFFLPVLAAYDHALRGFFGWRANSNADDVLRFDTQPHVWVDSVLKNNAFRRVVDIVPDESTWYVMGNTSEDRKKMVHFSYWDNVAFITGHYMTHPKWNKRLDADLAFFNPESRHALELGQHPSVLFRNATYVQTLYGDRPGLRSRANALNITYWAELHQGKDWLEKSLSTWDSEHLKARKAAAADATATGMIGAEGTAES